ncbi:MAG TPA: ABC transporter permease [Candidatus Thermoplasmatota archaeon]|nr:ABC transporter permease [Candidatus Thermoplasmatota archaeon]
MRIITLFKKDAKVILRSRLLLATLVVYPLLIVGIIGYAFSEPNTRVPIAVLNKDLENGQPDEDVIRNPLHPDRGGIPVSTSHIIRGFGGTPGLDDFADLHEVRTEEAGRELLLSGQVQALVIFPRGFVDSLINYQQSAVVRVVVDQSDAVRANVTEILVRGIVQQLQELYVEQKVQAVLEGIEESLNPDPASSLYPGFAGSRQRLEDARNKTNDQNAKDNITLILTFLENIEGVLDRSTGIVESVAQPIQARTEGERSGHLYVRDLIVPAALGLSIFWTGSLATSSLIVYEREAHAYRRLGITPTSRFAIVGSKVLLTSIIILLQSLFIVVAAIVAWDTRIDNLPLTIFIIIVSTFASIGLGILLGGVSRDVNGTILLAVLVTFPMLFVSGLFYPISFMPEGAQIMARLFPLTYTVEGLRGSMLRGFGFLDGVVPILALLGFGLASTFLGTLLSRVSERR